MWSTIRDNFIIETESFEDFGEEQGGDSSSIDGFLCRVENYPLSKPMVNHNQKSIKTARKGKVGDEVAGDLLKRAGAQGWNGKEGGSQWMHIDFMLLTGCASMDIAANVRGKAQPSKLRGNELASFENTRVTSSGMIVTFGPGRDERSLRGLSGFLMNT